MILLNHDIHPNVEDPDIKRFKQELADYLGLSITYANMPGWDQKDQFDVCVEAKAFKVGIHPLCTNRLKTAPFMRWLELHKNEQFVVYYGFEKHEQNRIQRRQSILGKIGYESRYPLSEWNCSYKSTSEVGVNPPNTYGIWKHANCTGCLRAGRQHWYVVYCRRPDIFNKAKWAESKIGFSILKGTYLSELEPRFEEMRLAGIQADEQMPAASFWALTRRLLDVNPEQDQGGCQLQFSF